MTLQKQNISGYRSFKPESCTACLNVRNRRGPPAHQTPPIKSKLSYYGERIDSDTAGPFPESVHGFTPAMNFVDRYSRLFAVYFLRDLKQPNIVNAVRAFVRDHGHLLLRTLRPGTVDLWHTDNGTEFQNADIDLWATEMGLRRSYSMPEMHETNGAAERCWGTLLR